MERIGLVQKGSIACALMCGDTIEYEVCRWNNHVFRIYPNGKLGKADEQDIAVAS